MGECAAKENENPCGLETDSAERSMWLMKCPSLAAAASLKSLPLADDPHLPVAKVILSIDPLASVDDETKVTIFSPFPIVFLHILSACVCLWICCVWFLTLIRVCVWCVMMKQTLGVVFVSAGWNGTNASWVWKHSKTLCFGYGLKIPSPSLSSVSLRHMVRRLRILSLSLMSLFVG